jgi:hypothetical protein
MIQLINFLLLGAALAPAEPSTPPPEAAPLSPSPVDMVPGYEGAFVKMFFGAHRVDRGDFHHRLDAQKAQPRPLGPWQ